MIWLKHAIRLVRDLAMGTLDSGQWWMPLVVVVLMVAALIAVTTKTALPTTVYVLF